MDPPISNYQLADHLSEQYLLLLKMLIAFKIKLVFEFVLRNANEEIGFYIRLFTKSEMEEAVQVSCWNVLSNLCTVSLHICVCACTKGPLGEFVFPYLCLSGDFLRQTHTSSL